MFHSSYIHEAEFSDRSFGTEARSHRVAHLKLVHFFRLKLLGPTEANELTQLSKSACISTEKENNLLGAFTSALRAAADLFYAHKLRKKT
jgi:hypothetical protein